MLFFPPVHASVTGKKVVRWRLQMAPVGEKHLKYLFCFFIMIKLNLGDGRISSMSCLCLPAGLRQLWVNREHLPSEENEAKNTNSCLI